MYIAVSYLVFAVGNDELLVRDHVEWSNAMYIIILYHFLSLGRNSVLFDYLHNEKTTALILEIR